MRLLERVPGARRRASLPVYLTTAYLARFADEGMPIAVALLAIQRTGSAAQGAYVLTAWMAPHVLTAPLTGSLAGRVRRPRLFYSGALSVFAASIVVLALIVGRAPAAVTLAVALAGGSCGPIVTGGLSGLLASLTEKGAPQHRAYALDAATFNAAAVTGAAAVTLVAGAASPAVATAALGGGAAFAAVLVALLPYRRDARSRTEAVGESRPSLGADLVAGLAAVWRVVELRAVTVATVVAFVGIGGLALTAVLLGGGQGGAAGGGGYLMTAFAVGGLVGSLALARWQPVPSVHRLVLYALLGTGVTLAAAALAPSFLARVVLFALAGICDGPLLGATLRIRAEYAPPAVLPQVFTLGAGLKISAAACGAALTGTAAALGAPYLLTVIAGLQFVAALAYVLVRRAGARPPVPATTR